MRPLPLLSLALFGCGVECEPPSQARGTYAVFANLLTFEGANLEDFPSTTSPANGWSEWEITGDDATGAMTIAIDGQPFDVGYTWSTVECGAFRVSISGRYTEGDDVHDFDADGDFALFANHLEGTWRYAEDWRTGDAHGAFEGIGNVSGTRVDD